MVLKHKNSRRVFLFIFLIFAFQKGNGQIYLEKPNVATSNLRREFPNTKNGIFIFYDQLPFGLTSAQLQFAAQHYVGCQKITLDMVNGLRGFNNNFIVVNYRLAFGTYENIPSYLEGNDWINDWETVNPHTDWFITDPGSPNSGGRIRQSDWGWYLMDISGEINGNSSNGWKEYWVNSVLDQLRNTNCDGIFSDSYCFPWNLDYTPAWLTPPNDTVWIHHMEVFGNDVRYRFDGQPEQFYFIPNVGAWITTRNTCDYGAFVDGVMVEMFASPGPWDLYDVEDWKLEMNRVLDLERRNKIVICQPITEDEWASGERMFNLANYLLIKGEKTYYNLVFGENFYDRLIYFPECTIDLGAYIGEIPSSIDDLYDASTGLYVREYENGKVIVNPTWVEINLNLDKAYYGIDVDDLSNEPQIDIGEDGLFRDKVAYVNVSGSMTVGSKGGIILINTIPSSAGDGRPQYGCSQGRLIDNVPNPFNRQTQIRFMLSEMIGGDRVEIIIYDINGRSIQSLKSSSLKIGENRVEWDGRDGRGYSVASGVYFYALRICGNVKSIETDSKKMVLIR